MEDAKVTEETMVIKNSKEYIDGLIEKIKEEGGSVMIDGSFSIQLSYAEGLNMECQNGFSITLWPRGKKGSGISVKFDPYDDKICSGIVETMEENTIIKWRYITCGGCKQERGIPVGMDAKIFACDCGHDNYFDKDGDVIEK